MNTRVFALKDKYFYLRRKKNDRILNILNSSLTMNEWQRAVRKYENDRDIEKCSLRKTHREVLLVATNGEYHRTYKPTTVELQKHEKRSCISVSSQLHFILSVQIHRGMIRYAYMCTYARQCNNIQMKFLYVYLSVYQCNFCTHTN
jgi:hypothetical protein